MLTESELFFLAQYGLSKEDVFDGRRHSQAGARAAAKAAGKILVLGSPCQAYGHRLRTRPGHCAQCDPKKIAYQQRYVEPGYIYIAGSLAGRVMKIGSCVDVPQREHQLRVEAYGGQRDWVIIFHTPRTANAARVEHNARAKLAYYRVSRPYYKDGFQQHAGELLRCSFSDALRALTEVAGEMPRKDTYRSSDCWQYEFANESDAREEDS